MKWMLAIICASLIGCTSKPGIERKVLISMFYPNNDYQNWLGEKDSTIQFFQAYGMSADSLMQLLPEIDAILLTGGKDIDPSSFGKDTLKDLCGPIDPYRDSLEFALIDHGFRHDIPLFGGCRGMQIINVKLGGSLIVDLPSMRATNLHQREVGDAEHKLIDQGLSNFLGIIFTDSIHVNSNHHQAIDELADGFEILAMAEDSALEAIFWKDTTNGPEIFCWQWHPERMQRESIGASTIRNYVVNTIQRSSEKR